MPTTRYHSILRRLASPLPLAAPCIAIAFGAPSAEALTLTPEEAAAYAVRHNPSLEAARMTIDEARGRLVQSGRLSNPEIETGAAAHTRGKEFSVEVGISQKFPLTDRLRLERAVSAAELAAAEAEVAEKERDIAGDARQGAVRLAALAARQQLKREQAAAAGELADTIRAIAERGEASPLDAGQLALEARQFETEILDLRREAAETTGELRATLGMAPDAELDIAGSLSAPPAASASPQPRPAARPDYEAATALANAAELQTELARARRWDDIRVGIFAEFERAEDAPEGLEDERIIGFRLSLPLPLWNRNEGAIAEAAAAAERRRREAAAVEFRISSEVERAAREMNAAAETYRSVAGSLIPESQSLESQYLEAYQSGQASLTDVLRIRAQQIALEALQLDSLESYHLARARLAAALGRRPAAAK